MALRRPRFKIVLPALYLLLMCLFIGGIIVTIAEGPNPLGFLYDFALYPGVLALYILPLSGSSVNGWYLIIVVACTNLAIYFCLGALVDYLLRRFSR